MVRLDYVTLHSLFCVSTEAINTILRYTEDLPRFFSYKKITSQVLFKYLNEKNKFGNVEDNKQELTEKVKQFWVGGTFMCVYVIIFFQYIYKISAIVNHYHISFASSRRVGLTPMSALRTPSSNLVRVPICRHRLSLMSAPEPPSPRRTCRRHKAKTTLIYAVMCSPETFVKSFMLRWTTYNNTAHQTH